MTKTETPKEHLQKHQLAERLRRLGATDSQLEAVKFHTNNNGLPLDQWSFQFPDDIPTEAINLVKPYCALKWLILENPPPSRDRDDAWCLVGEAMAAPVFEMALQYRESQQKRAQKPRGKIEGSGATLNQIVEKLALRPDYAEQGAKELWPILFSIIDQDGLNPEEKSSGDKIEKYSYEYDAGGRRKSISYGRFANIVARVRKKSR